MKPRHVLEAQAFDIATLEPLLERAEWMRQRVENRQWDKTRGILPGRVMFSLFYEPSTRTRMSFESAAHRLGMRVAGSEDAASYSSRSKGETDLDSFRVLAGYHPDAIVVRHDKAAVLQAIAESSAVPIINAGDGAGQHPTQALLDLFTINHKQGRLSNLHVVAVGDMKNARTVRSLVSLLAKYSGNKVTFVTPPELKMRDDILGMLDESGVEYEQTDDLESALKTADVVYMTRIQAERGMDQKQYDQVAGQFRITPKEMKLMPKSAIVMHPLPRVETGTIQKVKFPDGAVKEVKLVNELDPDCDNDPRAAYFDQASYGMPVRMALLEWVVRR